jgi:hypothetical protein
LLLPAVIGALAIAVTGCSVGGGSSKATESQSEPVATTTTPAPTTTVVVESIPLTHVQFTRRLDRLCKRFNRKQDRRFGAAEDAAVAANDYEGLANLYERSLRAGRPFYRAVRRLGNRVPEEDAGALRRYLSLSRELDIYSLRYVRALRHHDDTELGRLNGLTEQTRNRRTRVTAKMGLRVCGS